MKKLMITSIILALLAMETSVMAQATQEDYLGLPGDNLDLFAVMKLFQESETLEGFEKSLNEENSKINNLDLNSDNMVDYIKVMDNIKGNVHTIVLQVAVDEMENQDVAVFTVQRLDDGQVYIQLTGDEELYGKNYIIEPIFDNVTPGQTPNPGYTGNNSNNNQDLTFVTTTTYEVAAWPVVRYIYLPEYIGWRSSWYYGYYPPYWHPWRPFYWHYYHGYQQNWYGDYHRHYRHWDSHRYQDYNDFYYIGHRAYSPRVGSGIRGGHYKETYSHPEQRKDGEELYRRTYSEQNNRSGERASGNNTNRRSVSQIDQTKQSTGNGTNRRSASQTNQRNQSTGVSTNRRSASQTNQTKQSSGTTVKKRRSETSSSRATTSAGTKTPTERSSSSTKTRRSAGKSSDGGTAASGRRSSTTSKSGTAEKRASKQSSKKAATTSGTKKETKRR